VSQIKNGQKPLSEKRLAKPARLNMDDIFGNKLGLDPAITSALEAKGMDVRFINAKILQDMGGWNEMGWRPVPMKEVCNTTDTHSFQFGIDPNGFIRRGDLVLAQRPKDMGIKHKQYLAQENERARIKTKSKYHAEELRRLADEAGLDARIHEGYDDEDSK
jgi:hypothetical protein